MARSNKQTPCKHCQRARWMMTILMLTTMLAVLYLNVASA